MADAFVLGESIRFKGELIAEQNVTIAGHVEGTVQLDGGRLEVAPSAEVIADLSAASVRILGQVIGNVTATERISIEAGGSVLGDLCAPSIQLEDGSSFGHLIVLRQCPRIVKSNAHVIRCPFSRLAQNSQGTGALADGKQDRPVGF